jgi:hypothetical protein
LKQPWTAARLNGRVLRCMILQSPRAWLSYHTPYSQPAQPWTSYDYLIHSTPSAFTCPKKLEPHLWHMFLVAEGCAATVYARRPIAKLEATFGSRYDLRFEGNKF